MAGQIADSVITLLNLQLMLCRSSNRIGDEWTIGYVGGFAKAVCAQKGHSNTDLEVTVLVMVFGGVFGAEHRAQAFSFFDTIIDRADKEAMKGMVIGAADGIGIFDGSNERPNGLVNYCHELEIRP